MTPTREQVIAEVWKLAQADEVQASVRIAALKLLLEGLDPDTDRDTIDELLAARRRRSKNEMTENGPNLIAILRMVIGAAQTDDEEIFDAAADLFLRELRAEYERRGWAGWDDLAMLQAAENALAADDDLDGAFPAIVATIRQRITAQRHAQASMN
jgi:hypothetical protein